jgi:hypothetical protein
MYVQGTDPEVSLSAGRLLPEIRSELRRFSAEAAGPAGIDQLQCMAAAWSSEEAGRYRALLDGADSTTRGVLVRRAALGCAPLALMSGAWLQWLTAPGHAEDPVALKSLALYAADMGVGHPRASRGDAYLELLRHLHLSENAVPAARLTRDQRIDDGAFYLPGVLLTMSRRPDDFLAEIFGADLCLRTVGLLPALTVVKELLPTVADWPGIDPATARQPAGLAGSEQCRRTVEALLSRADAGARGQVMLGFQWALNALRHWSDGLRTELDAARDPAYEMAELLRLRGREGAVYHRGLSLGGRSLSEWLRDSPAHPGPLLEVLASSRLVKPGRAEASPLVNGLISARGPMFRVFAPEDVTVLTRWIDSLPATGQPAADPTADGASQVTAVASAMYEMSPLLLADTDAGSTAPGRAPADLREAYHLL